jgi:hypothetical protein
VDAAGVDARGSGGARTWVGADRYQEASELAFHLPDHPHVMALNLTSRRNQYDLWPGFTDVARPGDALVLALDDRGDAHPTIDVLEPHFAGARSVEVVELRRGTGVVTTRRIWRLDGWRGGWPVRSP